jgi:hypothetical protein
VVVGGLILVALARPEYLKAAFDRLWRDNGFAVTVAVALLAVLAWRRRGMEFIAGAVITAVVVAIAAIPLQQASGLASVFYDESPKFVYIVPTLLAIAAAVGVAALWASDRVPLVARAGVTALLLVVVAIPLNDPVKSEFSLANMAGQKRPPLTCAGRRAEAFGNFRIGGS